MVQPREKLLDIKVGNRQSPIDIVQAKATFDHTLKNLKFSYPSFEKAQLQNNGFTVLFSPSEEGNTSAVSSGPVSNQYKLAQFHFHWGEHNEIGSEHTVDSKPYAAELHLVHYNTDLYGSAGEALTAKDGLTVFGIFLKVGDQEHTGLKNITDIISGIHANGSSVTLEKPFNPQCLFPDSLDYWSYPGSLTTPPLSESVTWVVFKEPIIVSSAQIAAFREIKSTDGQCLCENFRPTCDLNERIVRASSSINNKNSNECNTSIFGSKRFTNYLR
ncbi:LOW QUALITY PROTEIN: carbonic anhydrase 7-like [Dendronephthya gigantea]|uniref:LOW QUALITY PROTEIN: carbonic anhydrase 7-like n=1 Tax=Dendronephthya gigantea TaxID=151771 RepID=UPI00106CBCBB|nr:LOW QUALITY PROTEIN: carbonic anhydrase 7-like [Dendronephthya gigantea]